MVRVCTNERGERAARSVERLNMSMMSSHFQPGTTVRVRQTIMHRSQPIHAQITGVVEAWEDLPTGSWKAGGKDGKLWLRRLKLRKEDGEIVFLVIDRATTITVV